MNAYAGNGKRLHDLPPEVQAKIARRVHHTSPGDGFSPGKTNNYNKALMNEVKTSKHQHAQAKREGLLEPQDDSTSRADHIKLSEDRSKRIDGRAHQIKQKLVNGEIRKIYSNRSFVGPMRINESEMIPSAVKLNGTFRNIESRTIRDGQGSKRVLGDNFVNVNKKRERVPMVRKSEERMETIENKKKVHQELKERQKPAEE